MDKRGRGGGGCKNIFTVKRYNGVGSIITI